jgi:hypothetical protein
VHLVRMVRSIFFRDYVETPRHCKENTQRVTPRKHCNKKNQQI